MRYSKDHKAATHAKIVRNASVQLREKGARGVGVADLMKDVGLTHGGFYAHFESRDDLVTEAVAYALAQNAQHWSELIGDKPVEARFPVLAESYLTPKHRDRPGEGCALAALAADVTREGPKTRRVFLNKLDNLVSLLAGVEGRAPAGKTRQKAISSIATMMGTLVLARIAGSGALSEEILEAGKSAARDGLAGAGANRRPAGRRGAGAAAKPKRRVR
jgi:TetR/AcrR family transcriptional repressor of nem operon